MATIVPHFEIDILDVTNHPGKESGDVLKSAIVEPIITKFPPQVVHLRLVLAFFNAERSDIIKERERYIQKRQLEALIQFYHNKRV